MAKGQKEVHRCVVWHAHTVSWLPGPEVQSLFSRGL